MRFLADESCDFAVVRALRDAGHSVRAVAELSPRAEDPKVLDLAVRERNVLLTEDKDFGQLVFAAGRETVGVIFTRFPATARKGLAKAVVDIVTEWQERLIGRFVVVQPGRVRIIQTPHRSRKG
jgi:predicted nuclease of predicted toxin-antitoxin system